MNEQQKPGTRCGKWVRVAVMCALPGLAGISLFLGSGFGPWSLGVGFFLGVPLLLLAVVLYLIAVFLDLRQHGAL